eukprot:8036565-Pyramimonas_sp.AAC.1
MYHIHEQPPKRKPLGKDALEQLQKVIDVRGPVPSGRQAHLSPTGGQNTLSGRFHWKLDAQEANASITD